MKHTLFNLTLIALTAVTIVACNEANDNPATTAPSKDTTASQAERVNSGTLKFAYVNTDSLSVKFDMIKDFEEEMLQERIKMENQLQGMVRALEKDFTDAQRGAAGLSDEALAILQQKLAQKEQEVMQQKNAMESQLMRSEQDKTDRYLEKVSTFLDDYAKAEGYDIIYGFNGLNNVLYIDEAFDITDQVVDSLNTLYAADKLQASK